MRMRNIISLAIVGLALAVAPGASLAVKPPKDPKPDHVNQKGGLPALRTYVVGLESNVKDLQTRVNDLETQMANLLQAVDNDGDGFSEIQGDCDDANPQVFPGAGCDATAAATSNGNGHP